jgi:hypothetical protein
VSAKQQLYHCSALLHCVIDALDECEHESQTTQITQTFGKSNHKKTSPRVHFLITSRPYPEIRESLIEFGSKSLSLYKKVKDDLQVPIQKATELSQNRDFPKEVILQISNLLQEESEGTSGSKL